uniref:Ig-like domain-containing protein n=1 Tax=Heterorhabditis bacteriophora TaxID=37862 RepID=A0A1I7XUE3_HETBA
MLLPIHSTTALMCEPVFSGDRSTAIWYRDGKEIATVTSDTNAVFENRNYSTDQPVPEVGFLIVNNISKADEGLFWCRHSVSFAAGEVFSLRVAFVDPIPPEGYIQVTPPYPSLGQPVQFHCPIPEAVPSPSVIWRLNGEPISLSSSDASIFPNGTLFVRYFSLLHFGLYECVVVNFAGSSTTKTFIDSKHIQEARKGELSYLNYGSYSCAVLLYLLCALVLLRPSASRPTLRPSMWTRAHPLLGPGFRKAIVPIPDFISQSNNRDAVE